MARRAAVVVLVAVFLAFSGAFGSSQAPFGLRVLYWLAAIAAGAAVEATMVSWVFARLDWIEQRPWCGAALRTLATALPTTLLAWGLAVLMFGGHRFDPGLLPDFLLPVLVVTAGMVALTTLVARQPATTHGAQPAHGAQPSPASAAVAPHSAARLLQRLPPRLRGAALLAVEAEDHYLRLHTVRGSELILLRLADALRELDGIEGAQVHRSWWVARDAVTGVARDDGRISLILTGGVRAPVSRSYVKALRDQGWF